MKNCISDAFDFGSGVQQGSCLEPVLLLIYAAGLFKIIDGHFPNADDTEIYLSFRSHSLASQDAALRNIENCVADVRAWTLSNRLLINDGTKNEFSCNQKISLANVQDSYRQDYSWRMLVKPVKMVSNLGAWFDSHMSMTSHIGKVYSKAFRSL